MQSLPTAPIGSGTTGNLKNFKTVENPDKKTNHGTMNEFARRNQETAPPNPTNSRDFGEDPVSRMRNYRLETHSELGERRYTAFDDDLRADIATKPDQNVRYL